MALEQYEYTCKVCDCTFEAAPPEWFEDKNLTPPVRCPECRSSGRRVEYEYICCICREDFTAAPPEWFEEKGLNEPTRCDDCKNSKPESHTYICKICGEGFEAAPPKWFKEKDLTPPRRCNKCKSSSKRIEYKYTCRVCGHTFEKAPPAWFKEKGLNQPTRCEECKRTGRRVELKYPKEGKKWEPKMPFWKSSNEHQSDSMGGKTHFDVEHYDSRGKKDKSAGKLHISGEPHEPSMKDIHLPKKKDE